MIDRLVNDLNQQFQGVNDRFDAVNILLTAIELAKKDGTAEADKAWREQEAAKAKLEVATRAAMESAGLAFLKEQKESSPSSTIPVLADELEANLFNNKAPPKPLQPYLHPGGLPSSFPILKPRAHKLDFSTFDGKEDPLPWINRCEQFFRGQKTHPSEHVWYASYHLTGGAQQWYMRLTQDKVMDWAYFAQCVNERFGPLT